MIGRSLSEFQRPRGEAVSRDVDGEVTAVDVMRGTLERYCSIDYWRSGSPPTERCSI